MEEGRRVYGSDFENTFNFLKDEISRQDPLVLGVGVAVAVVLLTIGNKCILILCLVKMYAIEICIHMSTLAPAAWHGRPESFLLISNLILILTTHFQ